MLQSIPADTKLRTLFITDTGEAYVDFSPELSSKHPGGSLSELLTVYAIVDTLTVNLPAIVRVQILVDGKEVDTLAGHVDLRRPLPKNLTWTRPPDEAPPAPPPDPILITRSMTPTMTRSDNRSPWICGRRASRRTI